MALRSAERLAVNLDTLLDEIADRVATRMLSRLERGALPSSAPPVVYTTHKDGPHLPGKTRRWMLEHVKNIPGARKVGRDWLIDASAYRAWLTAEDSRQCAKASERGVEARVASVTEEDDDEEIRRRVERSLSAGRHRRSK